MREALGDEIFEIFTEEVAEITQTLADLYQQWNKDRQDRGLLTEIRRAFHTLKGSGRMAGAFALGDFGWAHEDLLNQVLSGRLVADNRVSAVLDSAIQELQERQVFFQTAQQKDARVDTAVAAVAAVIAGEEAPSVAEPEPFIMDMEEEEVLAAPEPEPAPFVIEDEDELPDLEPFVLEEEEVLATPEPEPAPFVIEDEDELPDLEPFVLEDEEVLATPEPEPPPFVIEDEDELPDLEPFVLEEETQPAPLMTAEDFSLEDQAEQEADTRLVWQLFWEEFPEQLHALDQNLHHLQENPADQEIIRELEREFHTLKGGARMAQLSALADVSHEAESLLSALPRHAEASPAALEALQQAVDKLHTLAEQARHTPESSPVVDVTPASDTATDVLPAEAPQDTALIETSPALADNWVKLHAGQSASKSLLERVLAEQADSLPDISVLGIASRSDASPQTAAEPAASTGNHETIRLPAVFVDNLIDRVVGLNVQQVRLSEHFNGMGIDVDELIRTVARLRQQVRALELESEAQIHDGRSSRSANSVVHSSGGEFDALEMDQYAEIQRISRSLAESLSDLVNLESDLSNQLRKGEQLLQEDMRTTRQIQQDLLDTRLVALTMLVPRLRRLTRQVAAELGKQVTLEVQGEECELDRNLLQHMTAPLEHLIRNAISHGIELPEERERQGKPPTGRITLSVSRDDAEIVIRFRDDGQGLDRQQVRERGLELGLIASAESLPDNELDRLILRPGFSTAKTISQIAGRGIGMDVVYSELKALGGSLQIASRAGQGAEFSMRLPFTLIVNPVLLVEVEGQVFALPLSGIQGLARLSGADLQKVLETEGEQLEFAGQFYRARQLAEVLGAGGMPTFPVDEMFPVVFFKLHEQAVAWVIGHIQGRREVVLQPLGVLFKDCRLYSAATVAPDGSVFLVPDMAELARRVGVVDQPVTEKAAETALSTAVSHTGPARILVVDDSITVRRVTEKFLNTQEYAVSTAKDGMDALEQIGEFLPDVVLLDIEMPRMDGFELLGHLRRDPQWQHLPVVMISSRTAQKHREHAVALGATGFLGKPYQNEILLSTLESVLASGHVNDGERISA
ncbi:MAG: response regulator [Thiothrix sp.]|uniref:response regulator n=1 Tax=Thiothrix sp. TaxID=1032 RepID=UPI002626CF7A|nr:response regulator [Thiothrix sp.]MDD5391822.1 response regulator [Thiothrix sp.]